MREQPPPIMIPMEDPIIHTDDHPFCRDPPCPCAEDPELLAELAHQIEEGLLTPAEATNIVKGKML